MRGRGLAEPRILMVRGIPVVGVPVNLIVLFVALLAAMSGAARAQDVEDPATALAEAAEVIDLNRATLDDLLRIPDMEETLARDLLAARDRVGPFASLDDLVARGGALSRDRLLEVSAWLAFEPVHPGRDLRATMATRKTSTGQRRDADLLLRAGPLGVAVRVRDDLAAGQPPVRRLTGALRLALPSRLSLVVGDAAPTEGFGLLLGTGAGLFSGGALSAGRGLDRAPFSLARVEDVARLPPSPAARRLRGAALDWRGRVDVGAFVLEAQDAAASVGDDLAPPSRWLTGGVRWPRGPGRGLGVRAALWGSHPWLSLDAGGTLSGAAVRAELARDPAGTLRGAVRAVHRPSTRLGVEVGYRSGSRHFIAPLGFDSEAVPPAADLLSEGRNTGETLAGLLVRGRPRSRLGLEGEIVHRLEPARARRPFDRPVGAARAQLRWSASPGVALLGEWRFENRGAPGPSSLVESPGRRHAARLSLSADRKRLRFRADWSGRVELSTEPGDPVARVTAARDLFSLRGRWLGPSGVWIGGGMARHDLIVGGSAIVYEERPTGQTPSVTVRGSGRRWHLALGIERRLVRGGVYVTREDPADGTPRTLAGAALRVTAAPANPSSPR